MERWEQNCHLRPGAGLSELWRPLRLPPPRPSSARLLVATTPLVYSKPEGVRRRLPTSLYFTFGPKLSTGALFTCVHATHRGQPGGERTPCRDEARRAGSADLGLYTREFALPSPESSVPSPELRPRSAGLSPGDLTDTGPWPLQRRIPGSRRVAAGSVAPAPAPSQEKQGQWWCRAACTLGLSCPLQGLQLRSGDSPCSQHGA